jgi:hypothetical protein
MITYRVLTTAVATLSFALVFCSFEAVNAQSRSSQHASQQQTRKASQRVTRVSVRKAPTRIASRKPVRSGTNENNDGTYVVSVRGSSGACAGRSLSYVLQVRNGNISYGGGDATVSGRVGAGGATSLQVASGDRVGNASGRLSHGGGSGGFRGQVAGSPCVGTWGARRS